MKRNIFTRFPVLLLMIITIVALTGFSLASCKTDAGDDGGGAIPSELVAIWYRDSNKNGVVDEGEDGMPFYEFKADGTLLAAGVIVSGASFTVNGDKITLVADGVAAADSITFKIEGKKLTLSGSAASGFVAGIYAKK